MMGMFLSASLGIFIAFCLVACGDTHKFARPEDIPIGMSGIEFVSIIKSSCNTCKIINKDRYTFVEMADAFPKIYGEYYNITIIRIKDDVLESVASAYSFLDVEAANKLFNNEKYSENKNYENPQHVTYNSREADCKYDHTGSNVIGTVCNAEINGKYLVSIMVDRRQ